MGSYRWWFENRQTGEITIGQFPNWPMWGAGAAWIVRALSTNGSTVHDVAGVAMSGLWLYWGADEVVRGVNPWRRVLGTAVVGWQISRLLD